MQPLKTIPVFGETSDILVDGGSSSGGCCVLMQTSKPGGGPPLHRHTREDETFTVLEGEYEMIVDGVRSRLKPGDAFFAARGTTHTFRNVGSTTGRMLTFVAPSGLEQFLEQAGGLSPATEMSRILQLAEQFGLTLLPGAVV